jgi:hypothetical protein
VDREGRGLGAVETGCQGGQGSPRAVVPGGWMELAYRSKTWQKQRARVHTHTQTQHSCEPSVHAQRDILYVTHCCSGGPPSCYYSITSIRLSPVPPRHVYAS